MPSLATTGRACCAVLAVVLLPVASRAQEKNPSARWENEIAAFERQEKDAPPARGGAIFLGSSSIRLWKLDQSFPDLKALNRGFGGSQLADAVSYAPRLLYQQQPRLIVLYAGDNDLADGKKPEQVFADFKEFVAVVRKGLPETRILFLSIKPSPARLTLMDKARQTNVLIADFCKEQKGVEFVDVFGPLLGTDGKPRAELFRADGLHLNDKGYRVWAEILEPRLK